MENSNDWPQIKARLEAVLEDWEAHRSEDATELLDDYDLECLRAALQRVEDYDAIRKERDYYAIEFSALVSDVPPGARKTLLDTIRSLRQRVEELEQERDAEKLEAWGRGLTARAEAAEAKLAAWEAAKSLPDCPACAALDAAKGE